MPMASCILVNKNTKYWFSSFRWIFILDFEHHQYSHCLSRIVLTCMLLNQLFFWCCSVYKCDKSTSLIILSTYSSFELFFFSLLMLLSLNRCLAAILWWFFAVNFSFSFSGMCTCSIVVIHWTWLINLIDVFGGKIMSWLLLLRTRTVI